MDIDEYEREGHSSYADLAAAVAAVLTDAIGTEEPLRLQPVTHRAKNPKRLRDKLSDRGIDPAARLEERVRDLAGCRVIFYTNEDVTRFLRSGIVRQAFDVLDQRILYPDRAAENAKELYAGHHYLVTLGPAHIAMPEYARFAGMRCEIQVQTILDHAWAETTHDMIYTPPNLEGFGGRTLEGIERRVAKVVKKYLRPAGHELDKITLDFRRIVEGAALFHRDPLDVIIEASDNNERAAALETFAENVLPFYDDLPRKYAEAAARLPEVARRARTTPLQPIESVSGATPEYIVEIIVGILDRHRYRDVDATFDALCTLYREAAVDEERKALLGVGEHFAEHNIHTWRVCGPTVQRQLLGRIETLDVATLRALTPLLAAMLGAMLRPEIGGTSSTSRAITLHSATVSASDALRTIRSKAITLLRRQLQFAVDDEERGKILDAWDSATRLPHRTSYGAAVVLMVMEDTRRVIELEAELVAESGFAVRHAAERSVHRHYRGARKLPDWMRAAPAIVEAHRQVEAAALAFRGAVDADPEFGTWKTLVPWDAVFPPAWEDDGFDSERAQTYRVQRFADLVASVDEGSAKIWRKRLTQFAETAARSSAFPRFLRQLAQERPVIALDYLNRLEEPLARFLPAILAGVADVAEPAAREWAERSLADGRHAGKIAWTAHLAKAIDEPLLRQTLAVAVAQQDIDAVRETLFSAVARFVTDPGDLVDGVFLPALTHLRDARDLGWTRSSSMSWYQSAILGLLDEGQAEVVLDALMPSLTLEDEAEYILASLAHRWPAKVVAFLGARMRLAESGAAPDGYQAAPFVAHTLRTPLAAAPDAVLAGARQWFLADTLHFRLQGGSLLASIFPNLSHGLDERLATLVAGGNRADLAFVLAILRCYEGAATIHDLIRRVVAALDPADPLLNHAALALDEAGGVAGEFGFANLHAERKRLLEEWRRDESEHVRAFAAAHISRQIQQIASETRTAEAQIAQRTLDHGEELGGPDDE